MATWGDASVTWNDPSSTWDGDSAATITGTGALTPAAAALSGAGSVGAGGGVSGAGALTPGAGSLSGAGTVAAEPTSSLYDELVLEDLVYIGVTPDTDLDVAIPILSQKHPSPALSTALPVHQRGVDYTATESIVGFAHIWVGGREITYFRGKPTIVRNWTKEAPFGDKTAMWEMPQLDPWDIPGQGDLAFLRKDAPVVIGIVDPDTGAVDRKWSGFYHSRSRGFSSAEDYVFEAHGKMWAGLYQYSPLVPYQPPVDIGTLVPRLLNGMMSRPFNHVPRVTTGLTTRYRAPRKEYVWQSVQNILARDGWTEDGRQWTLKQVGEDDYRLVLKDPPSTVHATFAYGNPGIDVDVTVDDDSRVDHVFCSWTTPAGGESLNMKYPGYELTNGEPYPNSDAGQTITLGSTDAGTDSGTGVTDLQRKLVELGYTDLAVTGVMSSAWVAVVRDVQEQMDLLVDGIVGPQTWTAIFTRVDESIDLTPRRLPMAWKPATWPTKDSANGVVLGPNPVYDPSILPHQVDLEMGPNQTRAQVLKAARTYLSVHGDAVAVGRLSFRGCPDDLARTDLDLGMNVEVRGFEGEDVVLQVGRLSVDLDVGSSDRGGSGSYAVTVEADERARDALTIDQILDRNRDALPDPSRRPGNPALVSRTVQDEGFVWDADSPCGRLRRTAVNGNVGLWSRAFVPFSTVGRLAGIRLRSTVPFAFAVTAKLTLTENMMLGTIGNPFSSSDPWRPHMGWLKSYGLIVCYGSLDDACGYGGGLESEGYSFTGEFDDDNTIEYITDRATDPLVAVHLFARGSSGFVWGEFAPGRQT